MHSRPQRMVSLVAQVLASAAFIMNTTAGGEGVVYNLRDDWSDTANPNGVWAYRAGEVLLPHVPDWSFSVWTNPVPGWGLTLPFWFRSTLPSDSTLDLQPGDVVVHTQDDWNGGGNGPAIVTWTSPRAGVVDIAGGVWMARDIDRGNRWRIYVRGTKIQSGQIASGDIYSRENPFRFHLPFAQGGRVAAGDIIALEIVRTSFAGDFVGVDLQITLLDRTDLLAEIRVSAVDICWGGLPGRLYQVEYSSILTGNVWTKLGDPVFGNGANCVTDNVSETETRYYRVVDAD
jgi:hypothetical protein